MLDAGLISELVDRPEPENDDPRRRYYKLSPRGRAEFASELGRMQHALKLAGKRRVQASS
jgi:DNA-binding PadR family transcriptional regulator